MAEAKKKFPRFTSPKGVMQYPWLNKPDTKFKAEGEYRVKLRVSEEDGDALIAKLQPLYDDAIKAARDKRAADPKNKGKKIKLDEQDFYSKVVDDDGNETGQVEFTFKRKAAGKRADGSEWAVKPDLFDARGKKLSPDVKVFGGSIGKVNFEVVPYDTPKSQGIKLSMTAVQVIKVVESNRDASSYGFGDESADPDADAPAEEEKFADEGDGAAAGDEF